MKNYYSEWLRELEWYLTIINGAACTYTAMPNSISNKEWIILLENCKHTLKQCSIEKKLDTDNVYKSRMKHIKKMLKNLNTLNVPLFIQEDIQFFITNLRSFLSS